MAKSPMNTGGVSDTVFHIFEGTVTCMLNRGKRVRVGALGRVSLEAEFGPEPRRQELPGTYAQVLTVEFGESANPFEAHGRPLTESFGTLGELHEVLPSEGPPICSQGAFAHQNTAAPFDGVIYISPSITTPRDGHISKTGAVTLAGTGEPNHGDSRQIAATARRSAKHHRRGVRCRLGGLIDAPQVARASGRAPPIVLVGPRSRRLMVAAWR
jgi:hypothetical protein